MAAAVTGPGIKIPVKEITATLIRNMRRVSPKRDLQKSKRSQSSQKVLLSYSIMVIYGMELL
jgi:hypothetical protein